MKPVYGSSALFALLLPLVLSSCGGAERTESDPVAIAQHSRNQTMKAFPLS